MPAAETVPGSERALAELMFITTLGRPEGAEAAAAQALVLECDHSSCHAEDLPGAAADCRRGFGRCCGCCAPDWDSAWEAQQDEQMD